MRPVCSVVWAVEMAAPLLLPIQVARARTDHLSQKIMFSSNPGISRKSAVIILSIHILAWSSKVTSRFGAPATAVISWQPSGARLGSKLVGTGM